MKNIPDKIYLDIGPDCDADDFDELHEVTWSADNATGHGIEYHRSCPLPANVAEAVGRLEAWVDRSVCTLGPTDDTDLRTILEHMKEREDVLK